MIDAKKVRKGHRLVHIPTGEEFTVLCSCPRSKPIQHTRRYIQRNPADYSYPEKKDVSDNKEP